MNTEATVTQRLIASLRAANPAQPDTVGVMVGLDPYPPYCGFR